MPTTIPQDGRGAHLDSLELQARRQAKADLKNLDPTWRIAVGRAIARAIQLAGLSQKEAAALLGRDQAQVQRWTSGAERPQFDVLFAVAELREPLVIALAGLSTSIEVTTTIAIRRTA